MTTTKTSFVPQKNGFRFLNYFELKLPSFKLPLAGEIDLNDVVFGLCGGMCFGALDYFYASQSVPPDVEVGKINRKLFGYLADRQLDSLPLPNLVKVIEWMLREKGDVGTRMARYEIPKLRRLLDKGEPAVLALIRVEGMDNPTRNHQVLAVGYDYFADAKKMTIYLYDPNHPGVESRLSLDLASPSHGIAITQSNDVPARAFFVIDYKKRKRPPVLEAAPSPLEGISFALPAVEAIRLRWPVDSRRVNQYFGENPDTYKPFKLPGHEGIDLYAPGGANVYAAADGVVYQVAQPADHPYGLQVRLRHKAGDKVFHTIYAHLADATVQTGQAVKSGDLIGHADNSGNSFGDHLHLTLKIDGEQTPGYPAGIVDPLPFLEQEAGPPAGYPPSSGVTAYTTQQTSLYSEPSLSSQPLALLPVGEALNLLGDAGDVSARIGKPEDWLLAQTASGWVGNVPAWNLTGGQQALPPSDLVVYPIDAVNLRSGPATIFNLLATLDATEALTVLGDADNARAKLGKPGEWLSVQTAGGRQGYVAAWLVRSTAQDVPSAGLAVYPNVLLNVRARPELDSNVLTVVTPADRLTVLGDAEQARQSIGKDGDWLNVRTPSGFMGYVAAWLVRSAEGTPQPPPAAVTELAVYPTADINLRAQASQNSPRVGGSFRGKPLQVLETDLAAARAKIRQPGQWLYVQASDGKRGWAAAWLVEEK